ncbi:tail fiber assembly protein [Citrobacter braakii]|uniref:tail fiber assembly protein n=1 Tax=Citrobacter braakii TaxID=57706 RepID=UPI00242FE99B|nr:tail fiber assembly protein [Citrobacter braakii]WFV19609.1 tail fiber assembly protein [Citrobacter braakii]
MMNMKNFVISSPETEEETLLAENGAIILRDDQGREWYSSQALFSAETVKVMYDSDNIVRAIDTDISTIYPHKHSVAEVEEIPEGADIYGGWIYSDGAVIEKPLSHNEIVIQADYKKSLLLDEARATISLWQTELQLGSISDEDKSRLIVWVNYIKSVQEVDTSKAPHITWPEQPGSNS